jgi:hypothetical protein
MKNENDLLENKELREQLISNVEVLEKVKMLLLVPETEISTIHQLASYYEVDIETIQKTYQRNKDELDLDGVSVKNSKDFLSGHNVQLETFKGKSVLTYNNGVSIDVPNRGIKVFSRRAVLRIGMLLRDSNIAREVRTQLLNIEEKTSSGIKVQDINEEQKIAIEVGMAFASGDATAIMFATTKMMAFKNRHIAKLEQSNKALANGILEWEDRSRINFAVRKLTQKAHIQYGLLWNELYKQLKNKYHMDLKARGKQPWIQYVKEDEWNNVIKCFSALCEYYNQSPSDMFYDLQVSEEVSTNA